MSDVRAHAGVPVVAQFGGTLTPSPCAPLVVDSLTGDLYSLATGDVVVRTRHQGLVRTLDTNYVSGTGTAGVDNTAQAVVTIAVAANTLTQLGDRLRVRAYWRGDTGAGVTGTITLNGVQVSHTTDGGAASLQVNEAWLHYIDATHANIISMDGGVLDPVTSNNNVAGFNWAANQNITMSQDKILNNHIVVFFLSADVFHKG